MLHRVILALFKKNKLKKSNGILINSSKIMNYLFIFDIFNSHIYVLFCSNDAEGIKSTVVPEGHFAVSWATYHCKLHFSLLHSPQTLGHTHFPLPKFSFCNSTCNISPSLGKRWKEKRWSTCRGVVWKPCHALHQLSPCPMAPLFPAACPLFWAGGKSSPLQEQGAQHLQG